MLEGPKGPVASMVGPQAVELPATEPVLDALSTRVTSATLTVASHLAGSTEAAEAFKNFARDKHHYYCGDESIEQIDKLRFVFCGQFTQGGLSGLEPVDACFGQAEKVGSGHDRWVAASTNSAVIATFPSKVSCAGRLRNKH